ncbi:PAS domain S-box protein [Limnoglobus roseus]|uniref:PAS domain-containing protein n=1 Tax=Limnoglobus roseus TaxID=2598579 RepID=A0A5C1AQ69_9BACT|nr:PAS domain S-box protein [Limnoglobus roseus]QEL20176.1 PAS domain-containing protein [Limnoglobus roseus]
MFPLAVSLEQLAVAGFAFDAADRIVSWNPAAAELYGLTPDEAVGQSVLLFIPHEATADYQRAVEVVHQKGRWHGELRTMSIDYTQRIVETAWASVEAVDGRQLVVALHTDVTDRQKRLREDRRTAALKAVRSVGREVGATPGVPPLIVDQLRLVTEWEDLSLLQGNGRGVLVAGTDRLTLELVRQLLVGHDYVVFVADNLFDGAEALRRFRDGIRAAVLDFPDANAGVVLQGVRPQLPVVLLTPSVTGTELLETLSLAIAEEELHPV